MELTTIEDAFERAIKKQKLSASKTRELIDGMLLVVEQAMKEIQAIPSEGASSSPNSVLMELKRKLNEMAPMNQLEASQKDLAISLGKYGKLLEKQFNTDLSNAYRNVDWDTHTVNQIIAGHFYRQGMFEIGDCFVNEANEVDATSKLRSQYVEMYQVLAETRSRKLEPALAWAIKHREHLLKNGSNLELKLHSMQFFEILRKGSRNDALAYAKAYLGPFANTYKTEIQKLMACLLWAGRLDQSPYADLVSQARWDDLANELVRQFCNLLGHSYSSPLDMVVRAGVQALPTILKMASVMAATNQDWQTMKQLPMPVDLGSEFQFHSIFVCPVLWEPASEENPPMFMPCGHVLCKQAVLKLSKSSTRLFKCPYCPADTTVAECKQLYF
ncbi:putative transcription factor interactor and regulator LisH family [Dioscorea sansibarensis]